MRENVSFLGRAGGRLIDSIPDSEIIFGIGVVHISFSPIQFCSYWSLRQMR